VGTLEIQSTGCRIIVAVSPNSQASKGEDFRVVPPGWIGDVDSALEISYDLAITLGNYVKQSKERDGVPYFMIVSCKKFTSHP
jgi:hypothetical protein